MPDFRIATLSLALLAPLSAIAQPAIEPRPAAPDTPVASSAPSIPATPASNATGFNPAISLILSGRYARTSRDPADASIRGFPASPDAPIGLGDRGFSLGESELGLSANIDPYLRGVAHVALGSDDSVSVEEAYLRTTALGSGLTLKAGRFFSGIGYLNAQHAHVWDFADNPLAYQALLGTQYGDDGVQLTWLAPTDHFIELGLELGRGRGFPGADTSRNGAGMVALTAHSGGDIGDSQSWRGGVSLLQAKAEGQALTFDPASATAMPGDFTGRTRVWVADAVWKWAPRGNASVTNLKIQGEYLRSTRSGDLTLRPDGGDEVGSYRVAQSGWYLQAIYQFMPRWRVGMRTERLATGAPDFGSGLASVGATRDSTSKQTLMLEFNPSEYSRIRLQYARDRSRDGAPDNQLMLQFIVSLGAHGAHAY